MSTYDDIKTAIQQKKQVVATYDGHVREMCPHVLGTKDGRAQALFYQFGGTSNSGLGPVGALENWRCIELAKLTGVSLRDGDWYSAPNHSRPQTCVGIIDVEVAF